jgi:hypothetical protein
VSPPPETPFQVDRIPKVDMQVEHLAKIAISEGFRDLYFESLLAGLKALENHPQDWGDPKYRTKHHGGLVCQRVLEPLIIDYAVYEQERVVLILSVTLVPWFASS